MNFRIMMKLYSPAFYSIILSAFIFLSGCDMTDQQANSSFDDLSFDLNITPTHISQDEEITATYLISNNSSQSINLVSACTQLARGVVFEEEQFIELIGSTDICFTAISEYEIAAGEFLEMEWNIKPIYVNYYTDGREPDTTFANPGEFVFTVKPDVFEVNKEQISLPKMEGTFIIE